MYRTALVATLALTSLTGCVSWFRSGTSTAYLATKLCGVHLDGKTRQTHLRVLFAVVKSIPRNAMLEVEFEDPARAGTALSVARPLTGNESTIEVLSPPVTGVRPREYQVIARVYATAEKKQVLGTHRDRCESLVDERDLLR